MPIPPSDVKPTDEALQTRKQALREQLLALRAAMPQRTQHEQVLANRTRRWLATMPATRLGFYWPVRGECDLTSVVTHWLADNPDRLAALPRVNGDLLRFVAWDPQTSMQADTYGIPAPPATAPQIAPQVLLIPCVGVDRNRYRLGYGGGYYDRTLATLTPRPVLVGICFDLGRVKNLAPQAHDIRMDLVITESGVL
ncbi:MAG TPA: 5-formyltetrahydrofolate cyclo-ligase [Burkholderiaceae bacterium]|nr:5-formyltetrahydrofolate cyclo-ligase [Burkholderiaceae bacterium]